MASRLPRNPKDQDDLLRFAQRVRSGALADNATLTINNTKGWYEVKDLGITTAKLANLSVTTGKIADANVTVAKLLLATNPALEDATGLRVKLRDTSLTRDAAGVGVALATTSGLAISSGLAANPDGSTVTINGSNALVATIDRAGFRNKIVNGEFRVAQRGPSVAVAALTSKYTLDRWVLENQNDSTSTVTQDADVPAGKFGFSLKATVGTADASIAVGQFGLIEQKIEGYNIEQEVKASGSYRISFWAKSSLTGTFTLALRNSLPDRSYLVPFTISAANTWTQYTASVTLTTAGTWNFTTGVGLFVSFALACGTTFQSATTGSWIVGNFLAANTQSNFVGTAAATFQVYGVQIESGTVTAPQEPRPYGAELQLCQRYYEAMPLGQVVLLTNNFHPYYFKVTKRATPTITPTYTTGTGATFVITTDSFYQNANHSANSAFSATVDAEL